MGRINIIDTKKVTNSANAVFSNLTSIKKVKSSIEKVLDELDVYWEKNEDQLKFAKFLSSELTTLNEVIYCTEEFCSAINDYINALETTSSKSATGN